MKEPFDVMSTIDPDYAESFERSSAATTGPLLPCPLCQSTDVQPGICYVDEKNTKEDAARCVNCGCRATKRAWQSRTPAQQPGIREALERALWELTDLARPICSIFNRSTKKYEFDDEHVAKALPSTFAVIQQIRTALAAQPPAATVETEPCTTCNGIGEIDERTGGFPLSNRPVQCPDCPPRSSAGAAKADVLAHLRATAKQHDIYAALEDAAEEIARLRAVPQTSVDHLQARGRHYDIIQEAIAAYDEYMLDDDYDAQGTLDKIIKKMRERVSMSDAPGSELSRPEHRAPSASSPAEAAPSQRLPE